MPFIKLIPTSRRSYLHGFYEVDTFHEVGKFFTKLNGVRAVTPFLLVVLVLGTTDVVFAIDSIPTVFGITDDPFVVWSSNAMAVLGMRPLFFLLVGMVRLFRYLQYGLAAILGFVGAKMIAEEAFHDFHVIDELGDIYLSLGIIIGILAGSVLLSIVLPDNEGDEVESVEASAAETEN